MSDQEEVLRATRHWVDQAVIGLNLCPFAKAVQVQGRVRYVVSTADTVEHLIYELGASSTRCTTPTPSSSTPPC
jgi:hypothetical protein